MQASLTVPTATSVRTIPVRLLEENRTLHEPAPRRADRRQGELHAPAGVGARQGARRDAGDALDLRRDRRRAPPAGRPSTSTSALPSTCSAGTAPAASSCPSIKHAETLEFAAFFAAYNELIRRAQAGQLTPEDFADTTVTLTNPGMLGTTQSVPRLMAGQSLIVAAGSIGLPGRVPARRPRGARPPGRRARC